MNFDLLYPDFETFKNLLNDYGTEVVKTSDEFFYNFLVNRFKDYPLYYEYQSQNVSNTLKLWMDYKNKWQVILNQVQIKDISTLGESNSINDFYIGNDNQVIGEDLKKFFSQGSSNVIKPSIFTLLGSLISIPEIYLTLESSFQGLFFTMKAIGDFSETPEIPTYIKTDMVHKSIAQEGEGGTQKEININNQSAHRNLTSRIDNNENAIQDNKNIISANSNKTINLDRDGRVINPPSNDNDIATKKYVDGHSGGGGGGASNTLQLKAYTPDTEGGDNQHEINNANQSNINAIEGDINILTPKVAKNTTDITNNYNFLNDRTNVLENKTSNLEDKTSNFEPRLSYPGGQKVYDGLNIVNNSDNSMTYFDFINNSILFSSNLSVPTPIEDDHAATKKYVDDNSGGGQPPTYEFLDLFAGATYDSGSDMWIGGTNSAEIYTRLFNLSENKTFLIQPLNESNEKGTIIPVNIFVKSSDYIILNYVGLSPYYKNYNGNIDTHRIYIYSNGNILQQISILRSSGLDIDSVLSIYSASSTSTYSTNRIIFRGEKDYIKLYYIKEGSEYVPNQKWVNDKFRPYEGATFYSTSPQMIFGDRANDLALSSRFTIADGYELDWVDDTGISFYTKFTIDRNPNIGEDESFCGVQVIFAMPQDKSWKNDKFNVEAQISCISNVDIPPSNVFDYLPTGATAIYIKGSEINGVVYHYVNVVFSKHIHVINASFGTRDLDYLIGKGFNEFLLTVQLKHSGNLT